MPHYALAETAEPEAGCATRALRWRRPTPTRADAERGAARRPDARPAAARRLRRHGVRKGRARHARHGGLPVGALQRLPGARRRAGGPGVRAVRAAALRGARGAGARGEAPPQQRACRLAHAGRAAHPRPVQRAVREHAVKGHAARPDAAVRGHPAQRAAPALPVPQAARERRGPRRRRGQRQACSRPRRRWRSRDRPAAGGALDP
eukprot:scaffold1078_cov69-Phaeocystis_antarctica.AAC.1